MNILFLNEEIKIANSFFDEILLYDKMLQPIEYNIKLLYKNYYNLKYLENSLIECNNKDINCIIVGNSYIHQGIEETLLNTDAIKLSMDNQDLYYSFRLAEKVVLSNKNIKQCILNISYFTLRHDISKG